MTDTDPVLAGMRTQWTDLHTQAKTIIDNPASDAAALVKAEKLFDQADQLATQITERKTTLDNVEALRARQGKAQTWANEPQRTIPFNGKQTTYEFSRIEGGASEIDKKRATGGYKSLGHFAYCQIKQGRDGRGEPDAILRNKDWIDLQLKAPSGMFENADPDGGLLVPPEFSNQIYERMVAKNQILSYLTTIPISGNTMSLLALKEDSRADGSRGGGVLGYWEGEADQYQKSRPLFRSDTLKLHKLTVLTYVTDELINDSAVALQAFLMKKAPDEINFKVNDAVINGLGVGMPLGIMNSNSKITVSAVSGQGAGTIVYQNVTDMYARVVAGQRGSLIWLYNQDAESILNRLYMATGTAAGVAIFTPNRDANGFTLMGRPALVMEQCQTAGTAGDLIAFATDGYAAITKGGIESFMSIHLRFDYDETAFKWRFRMDGRPYDDVALTPYKGSNTVSSIVVLNSTRT
jgi:HK97 family phage major capsid protein